MLASDERAQTFAANRATGHIALAVAAAGGVTRRARVHEDGSLRVRFPNAAGDALEAVIVNTGGGMAGGDRFSIDIDGRRRRARSSPAPRRRRRSIARPGPTPSMDVRACRSAAGARLAWLPQETILFDRARLSRRIDVDLAEGASLLMAEAVVFGRAAMGEAMQAGHWSDRWRVRRGGTAAVCRKRAARRRHCRQAARRAPSPMAASRSPPCLIAPGDEATLAAVRALEFNGEVGISAWNGIAVARLCARRHDACAATWSRVLAALGTPLPRLWLHSA